MSQEGGQRFTAEFPAGSDSSARVFPTGVNVRDAKKSGKNYFKGSMNFNHIWQYCSLSG